MLNFQILFMIGIFIIEFCHARPADDKKATIISQSFNQDSPNSYNFRYETSNGIRHQETGTFVETGYEQGILTKTGEYSYIGADNQLHIISYIADENGFRSTVKKAGTKITETSNPDDDRIGSNVIITLSGGGIG